MWLYQTDGGVSANDEAAKEGGVNSIYNVNSLTEQIKALKTSFTNFITGTEEDLLGAVNKAQEGLISWDNSTKSLLRSMSGFIPFVQKTEDGIVKTSDAVNDLKGRLEGAFFNVQEIGGTFKDVTDTVEGLANNMGRMVNPSQTTMENMVIFTKSTKLASADVASMVTNIIRYGGTQDEALATMTSIANEARLVGLNTTKYMKDVNTNLKLADGFGFKNGVTGVREMVKQAEMLRTEIDKIGASSLQNKVLTPEGAIEAAAGFQMLGGSVGALADPFQLLNMAQNDLAGLQKELVNSTKSAYVFNSETGEFKASTEDLYRLRQQAELVGGNFDEMARAGREAAKLDFIASKMSLDGLSEGQKGLIASLAQIDKGGKVTVDLPGFEEGGESLEKLANNANFKAALDEYAKNQDKTEKEIAAGQLTISETQAKDINIIKHALLADLGVETRKSLTDMIRKSNETYKTATDALSKTILPTAKEVTKVKTSVQSGEITEIIPQETQRRMLRGGDMYFGDDGNEPLISSAGQLYKGLPNDKIAVGTDLDTFLNQSMSLMDTLNNKQNLNNYINESTTKINNLNTNSVVTETKNEQKVNGKVDININLGGTINGDRNANLEEIFKDSRIQNQIMETVLTKLESYKKQQGVLTIS